MTTRKRTHARRLTRFIEVVDQLTSDFAPHPDYPRYRVPARPSPLDDVAAYAGIDPASTPADASRTLFMMEWDSLAGYSTFWHLHAMRLPSGERAYWVDDVDGRRMIAVGPGGAGADGRFARVLFKSNGQHFAAPILDSAPSRVSTRLRGEQLVRLFVDAFDCSANAWEAVDGVGRGAVRRWLKGVTAGRGRELGRRSRVAAAAEFLTIAERIVMDFPPHPADLRIGVAPRFTPTSSLAKFAGVSRRQLPRRLSRVLVRFAWWGAPGSGSTWELNAFDLHTGRTVYWIETDFGDEEERDKRHIIGTAKAGVPDAEFAQLFFATNGADFDVDGCCGSPPMEIVGTLADCESLVDLFVSAFTAANSFHRIDEAVGRPLDTQEAGDRRELVARYLDAVVSRRKGIE